MATSNINPSPLPKPASQPSFNKTDKSAINKSGLDIPKSKEQTASADKSIFSGKPEISRAELRQKLRYDPKIWKSQRDAGLNLNPSQRVDLEKEIPQAYGGNISKSDLKKTILKMAAERASSMDPKKRESLRKEINFLKKIGGINDSAL